MAINLLSIEPHKVSRDLSGYITYIYGPGGAGKTTFGAQMPNHLILSFEKGYNALPGVMRQDIVSWADMKQVLRQLDNAQVKERFSSIVIDTVDIAAQLCEKYVCSQLGIENIGDGGWAVNGWAKVKREWENTFRAVTMKGYALVFISHAKERTITRKDQTTYNCIGPSCSNAYNEIIKNMADIEGYIQVENGERRLILRSSDDTIECKSRFARIAPSIPFSYQSLVDAMNKAIDDEAASTNGEFITDERDNGVEVIKHDYKKLMDEFKTMADVLVHASNDFGPQIQQIIKSYLGNKKISETTPEQAELVYLINQDIKADLMSKISQ